MGIHRELAELVQRAGDGVLRDHLEFRAAFDDYLPEGAATEGDLNLLADAIRLGAFDRVLRQIDHGGDVATTIASQAARLAQQRGTQESSGARWALTVLAFAAGRAAETDLDPDLARDDPAQAPTQLPPGPVPPPPPPPPPPIVPTVDQPATAWLPERTDDPFARPPADPRTVVRPPGSVEPPVPTRADTGAQGSRRIRPVAVLVVLVLLAGAGAGLAVLLLSDDPAASPAADTRDDRAPDTPTARPDTVVAAETVAIPGLDRAIAIGGRRGGVTVDGLGPVDATADGEIAAAGQRLIGLRLADGPCQTPTCLPWRRASVRLLVDGAPQALPRRTDDFIISAPVEALVELQMRADRYDQRISLDRTTASDRVITVLGRDDRLIRIGATYRVQPRTDGSRALPERAIRVDSAELFFFAGSGKPLQLDEAFVRISATYTSSTTSGAQLFYASEVHLEDTEGNVFPKRDLGTADKPDPVFIVPGDFTGGVFVIEGTRQATSFDRANGVTITYPLTLPRTEFRFGR
ncbi:hypothetical protein ACFQ0K_18940 [Nocardioides caeni]|uniref:Uncharacterized protein n=1 Tax=Nocardioides caeni TaxID=574700 RepID=A0A4V4HK65_9ACTN|nr:hypothetical protein [Nocardioides caeni]THV13176.1 hypothetical protein E9934_09350 [Nocardioides caeni]